MRLCHFAEASPPGELWTPRPVLLPWALLAPQPLPIFPNFPEPRSCKQEAY